MQKNTPRATILEAEAAAKADAALPKLRHVIQENHEFQIADDDNETIARATIQFKRDGLYLTNVWTKNKWRRKGLATKVLSAVVARYGEQDIYLSVSPYIDQPADEDQLEAFYGRFGFVSCGPMGLMMRPGDQR